MSSAPHSDPAQPPANSVSDSGVDDTGIEDDGDVISFDCFDAGDCAEKLLAHCRRVVTECSRIVMRLEDGSEAVLISKCELDSLEEALETFSRTKDVSALHERVRGLAQAMERSVLAPATAATAATAGEAN